MAGFREEFYDFIRDEIYDAERDLSKEPVLIRYLREQSEEQAMKRPWIRNLADAVEAQSSGKPVSIQNLIKNQPQKRSGKRMNPYAELREKDLLRQLGVIGEKEYLCRVFELVLRNKKAGIPDALLEKTCDLLAVCTLPKGSGIPEIMQTLAEMDYHYKRSNKTPLAEILEELENMTVLKVPANKRTDFEEILNDITEEIIGEILESKARAWLGDNNPALKKPRKTDASMQLLDMFFGQDGTFYELSGHQESGAELTEERIEDTKKLFDLLDKDPNRREVVIPVIIDPFTGMGLYIIGGGEESYPGGLENVMIDYHYRLNDFLKKGHNCAYAVFCFSRATYEGGTLDGPINGVLELEIIGNPDLYIGGCVFPGQYFEDAKKYYEEKLRDFDEYDSLERGAFVSQNKQPPDGCPKSFLRYFEWPLCSASADTAIDEKVNAYKEEERRQLAEEKGTVTVDRPVG